MGEVERVVVVGGGIGGLTVAAALRRAGVEVEVHEKFGHGPTRETGFTIWSYAIRDLIELGIDENRLDRIGSPIEASQVRNSGGKLLESMPVGEVSSKLGAPSYDCSRSDLLAALRDAAGAEALHMGSECVGIEQDSDSVTAILADGSRATGDLLIGADGIHSVLRRAVAPKAHLNYSGFLGSGGVLEFSHDLLPRAHHIELWSRGSKGGIADIGGGRTRWYLITHAKPGAPGPSREALLEHVRDWWPVLYDAIAATPADAIAHSECWDLDPLPAWSDGRLVLLGDAAHATTPFAAMGACTAIADAHELSRLLTSQPLRDAISSYQAVRKKRGEQVIKHSRSMIRVATVYSPILAWLRDEAFEHMPADKIEAVAAGMAAGTG
ncbi:MAG: FAD-dependent monooxygenase [Solirubrobacterales bacterium]|nr:FAD-dependent monooxygenase [Solirubrobacterales bacterium]